MKNLIKSYLLYIICAFGISMGVIGNVGVSSYNSMNLSIANSLNIQIGTVTIFLNIALLFLYMFQTKFLYKSKYMIQALAVFMFGLLINFFTYEVLGNIGPLNYIQRLALLSFGTIIGGSAVGGIIFYNKITFPIESVCVEVAKKLSLSFLKIRYGFDIFSVLISIALSMMNNLPLYVREGTIISMILLTASMNFSKHMFESSN